MDKVYRRRCCGIDVHKKSITVCVLGAEGSRNETVRKRTFRTFTRELIDMRKWLLNCGVSEIAMESTGQYWRSVWNVLEGRAWKLMLINPQHIKGVDGYKTDCRDAEWIATLLERKMLKGSYVPGREIRELRELTRQRVNLTQDLNRVKNRASQICEAGNIKIGSVATDLFGVSGRKMLQSIVEGRYSAGWMADYARGTLRKKRAELTLALEGTFTDHQRYMLSELMIQIEWLERRIEIIETEIERHVEPHAEVISRLMTIPGIDRITCWTLLAEIGTDAGVFDSPQKLASWAGLCPGNRASGGRQLSGRTRKANRFLRRVLCQSAWGASHKKDSFLSAFYRRMKSRKGHQKAIIALAHHLILIVYRILRYGESYVEIGGDYYDVARRTQTTQRLLRRLQALGYTVQLEDSRPPLAQSIPPTLPPAKRRGRPCKCVQRGISCAHGRVPACKPIDSDSTISG